LAHGNIDSLPVLLGLALIATIFQIANPNFLTPLNLTNLIVQISAVGTIAVGVVLVLLIAEIDLSVGAVSGLCAGIMAVLSVKVGVPGLIAVGGGIVAGVAVGLLQGFWIAKLHVPSFVVTLAGFLGWQGALLYVLGDTGTINLNDPLIVGIANTRLPLWLGWLVGLFFIVIYALGLVRQRLQRAKLGVQAEPAARMIGRILLVAIVILGAIAIMSVNRNPRKDLPIQGVPSAALVFVGCIVLFDVITKKTRFGRSVYAVGGNPEAARRAGINVDRLRIIIFVLSSILAACGGILAGSRLFAVNQSSFGRG